MKPLRLAVIGAGHLGRFHAKLAAENSQIDLIAVCDPQEESRRRVAQEVQTQPVGDYREIVDQIDAAIVASPTFTHREIGVKLLERGKALLIEKPIASTATEAGELVEVAQREGVVLQVGHVERFNPAFTGIEDKLRDPKFIEATRLSGYSFRSTDIGAVLDLMIHDLDLVLSIARSEVVDVQAMGISVLGGHEDMANVRLQFASGCVAQLTASRVSYEMRRTMQVVTTRSFATLDFAAGTATVVQPRDEVLRRQLDHADLAARGVGYWKENLFSEVLCKSTIAPPPVNAIEDEQREFVDSVQNGASVRVTGQAAADAVAIAEQIVAQIEDHAWDGHPAGRCGAFAMPALPVLHTPLSAEEERPYRRAG